MLKRLFALAVLAAALLAACNPTSSPEPTLNLSSPGGGGIESPAPIVTPGPSM